MFSLTYHMILLSLITPYFMVSQDNYIPIFLNTISTSCVSDVAVNYLGSFYQDTEPDSANAQQQEREISESKSRQRKAIDNVDDLLNALEKADADLRDFTASIKYVKEDKLIGDTQERRGKIYFFVRPENNKDNSNNKIKVRQFAVHFKSLILGDRKTEEIKDFVFDGRYLVERLPTQHQFFKREVVREGEEFDPLSIDGPFPLPIGQKKSALLKRFAAVLLAPDTEGRLSGFYHMQLTVRDLSDKEELEKVDLWYDPANLLPAKAVIIEKTGDLNTVELARIELNTDLDSQLFSTKTPDPADGWKIEVSRLENRNDK